MNQAPAAMMGGLTSDQLQRLNERFRCKDDFYEYLEKVLNVFLPKKKNCSIQVSTFDCPHFQVRVERVTESGQADSNTSFYIPHSSYKRYSPSESATSGSLSTDR